MSKLEEQPESLWEICLNYCVRNSGVLTDRGADGLYTLKDYLTLPPQISESIVNARYENGYVLDDDFAYVFRDLRRTKLKHIDLQDSDVTDRALQWLMPHCPYELNIAGCQHIVDVGSIHVINQYGQNLLHLFIGDSVRMFAGIRLKTAGDDGGGGGGASPRPVFGSDYVFACPHLRAFSLHGLVDCDAWLASDVLGALLTPLDRLSYLDLSGCSLKLEAGACLQQLTVLRTLVLYNVRIHSLTDAFTTIAKIVSLRWVIHIYYLSIYFFAIFFFSALSSNDELVSHGKVVRYVGDMSPIPISHYRQLKSLLPTLACHLSFLH